MFVKSKRILCILATSDARTMLISIIPTVAIAVGVGVSVGGESNKSVLEMIININNHHNARDIHDNQ